MLPVHSSANCQPCSVALGVLNASKGHWFFTCCCCTTSSSRVWCVKCPLVTIWGRGNFSEPPDERAISAAVTFTQHVAVCTFKKCLIQFYISYLQRIRMEPAALTTTSAIRHILSWWERYFILFFIHKYRLNSPYMFTVHLYKNTNSLYHFTH